MQQGKIKNLLPQINDLQKKFNDKDIEFNQSIEYIKKIQP